MGGAYFTTTGSNCVTEGTIAILSAEICLIWTGCLRFSCDRWLDRGVTDIICRGGEEEFVTDLGGVREVFIYGFILLELDEFALKVI